MTGHRRPLAVVVAVGALVAAGSAASGVGGGAAAAAATPTQQLAEAIANTASTQPWVDPATVVRDATPADRYAPASGCYVVKTPAGYLSRSGTGVVAAADRSKAEPFRFRAYDLGKYLLFGSASDFLAINTPGNPAQAGVDVVNGYGKGTLDETLKPVRDPALGVVGTAAAAERDAAGQAARAASTAIVLSATPSNAAEWVLHQANGAFTLDHPKDDGDEADADVLEPETDGSVAAAQDGSVSVAKTASPLQLELATGCATFPEISTQVTGPQPVGSSSYAEVQGYFDGHLHGMAFEFLGGKAHCGRPWHPYGVVAALVDCPDHGPGGFGAALEAAVSGTTPGHDTVGWPSFKYWPNNESLTHEAVYYTWLERAWRGGLRSFTNLLVDNGVLCEVYPLKKNSCNEMDTVRLENKRMEQLERYIDAQNLGPGKGWYRIVTDPFQARRVMNAGKLAVVKGIEVSVPFDCGEYLGAPRCTAADIDKRLDEVYAMGVRQMELTNKFDNALTGVTGDDGTTGDVVNAGNRYETGHFWKFGQCPADLLADGQHDKDQPDASDDGGVPRDGLFGAILELTGKSGAAPVYNGGDLCNTIGLTELGKHAISGLAQRGIIFDPDHMSALARRDAMAYVKQQGIAGVLSSHTWADDATYKRIVDLGGLVTPHATSASRFLQEWRQLRGWAGSSYPWTFGIGYGSDIEGFSHQPDAPHAGRIHYPFTGFGGVQIGKQVSGTRTYDLDTDGVDHYGLYPDWVEDLRVAAGPDGDAFVADMLRGSESLLDVWERAIGVTPDSCAFTKLTTGDVDQVSAGMSPAQVIATLGQPHTRTAEGFTYCSEAGDVTVRFGSGDTVSTVTTT